MTPNRYEALILDEIDPNTENNIDCDSQHETTSQEQLHNINNAPKQFLLKKRNKY